MSIEQHQEAAGGLVTPDGALDAQRFAKVMAEAISREVYPVSSNDLLVSCLEPGYRESDAQHRQGTRWPQAVDPGLVSLLHSQWMRRIGEWLGFEDPEPELCDGWYWVTDDMPGVRETARVLIRLHLRVLREVTESFEAEHGHSVMDVFLASNASGEEFDQSNARLHHRRNGLRRVK